MKKIFLFFYILMLTQTANAAEISKLNGEWYSYKWKYGYTLKGGKGYATVVNSPNFKEGQEIVRLAALSDTSFFGENVYKDGKFYKVKVTLKPDGKLYFEGEKNAKWEMEKITPQTLVELKKNSKISENEDKLSQHTNQALLVDFFPRAKQAMGKYLMSIRTHFDVNYYGKCSNVGLTIMATEINTGKNFSDKKMLMAVAAIVMASDLYRDAMLANGASEDVFSKSLEAYTRRPTTQQAFEKDRDECIFLLNKIVN
jgi:hypothetical protein